MLLSRFTIIGHSMEPTLSDGSSIIVSSLPYLFFSPKKNDIVVFFSKKMRKYMVKRISHIEKGNYIVQGDNSRDSLDSRKIGSITREEIIAKFLFKVR